MASRGFRRINVCGLHRKIRLRDGNIFFRRWFRFRWRNDNWLWHWRQSFWFWFGNCHLRFWRWWRLRFFFRLRQGRFNFRLWRRNNNRFCFRLRLRRSCQRDVNVSFVENFRRPGRGRLQPKQHDGVKRQRDCVNNYQRAFHGFNFVSIATFVMPACRKSSRTSTAAPKNVFSSPLMKTFGSGCSLFNCCRRVGS